MSRDVNRDAGLKDLCGGLLRLALFRCILDDAVFAKLLAVLMALDNQGGAGGFDADALAACYSAFVAELYAAGGDLGEHLLRLVRGSENPVVRARARGERENPEMTACMQRELELFSRLSAASPAALAQAVGGQGLPAYASTPYNFSALYTGLLAEAPSRGYGIFAAGHMFTLGEGGALLPVKHPDPQRLAQLTGYEAEREQVLLNTRALLRGLPANNILLYGDAGTGKSSTVKAIANEYAPEGLRLVELRKNQLYQIPALMGALAENPLKFILFIDDLSFPADDGDFTALKAILEGNISARPGNIVVYATSNRRHMVAERFADRQSAEEVHAGEALEEVSSLAARFGLTITFLKPDRELYTGIVKALAAELGLAMPEERLAARAEAHAIRHGGRSPRTARQFVELVKAEEELNSNMN